MSLISELKKIKKPRGYKMLFIYEADNGIIHLCGNDIIIEFVEKCFDIDVCCDFDTLWSKIKNCKSKDTVSMESCENGEYILKINNKCVEELPCHEYSPLEWSVPQKDDSFFKYTGNVAELSAIFKALDKMTINISLYPALQNIHFVEGCAFSCDFVSVERFLPYYLINEKNDKCGFHDDFSVNSTLLKNIDLIKEKTVCIQEYDNKIVASDKNACIVLKKNLNCLKEFSIPIVTGNPINIAWNILPTEGRQLVKNSISSTDKSISCPAWVNGGEIFIGENKVGECQPDLKMVLPFKDCIDGFNKKWFKDDKFIYFNLDDSGRHQRVFKI